MAHKKSVITARLLQALLTRIGSASSGTKGTLLARFQRDIQQSSAWDGLSGGNSQRRKPKGRKLRLMSIDMGIKNLAFCDAEVSYNSTPESGLNATMNVLRWKTIDLVAGTKDQDSQSQPEGDQKTTEAAEDKVDQYSPSVLSKTAYRLITEEILVVNPDTILIEKQRWRSGGGSAVQQWTVRVNTLEAMLWAILETLKTSRQSASQEPKTPPLNYCVYAVDPKRVGQYWLSLHALALNGGEPVPSAPTAALSRPTLELDEIGNEDSSIAKKLPSRSKAEKSAKIALLRSWLSDTEMSTHPSTPQSTPCINFSIDATAEPTHRALVKVAARGKKRLRASEKTGPVELGDIEIKKLDDVTDCFLQAAAWVAWELNRKKLLGVSGGDLAVDEDSIARMAKDIGEA